MSRIVKELSAGLGVSFGIICVVSLLVSLLSHVRLFRTARQLAERTKHSCTKLLQKLLRRAWKGSQFRTLLLITLFSAIRAWLCLQTALGCSFPSCSSPSQFPTFDPIDDNSLCQLFPPRWDFISETLFLLLVCSTLFHFRKSCSSLPSSSPSPMSAQSICNSLTTGLALITVVLLSVLSVIPTKTLMKRTVLVYTHTAFAGVGVLSAMLMVFWQLQVRMAASEVPIHWLILRKTWRRIVAAAAVTAVALVTLSARDVLLMAGLVSGKSSDCISCCSCTSGCGRDVDVIMELLANASQCLAAAAVLVFHSSKLLVRGQESSRRIVWIEEETDGLDDQDRRADLNESLLHDDHTQQLTATS